MKVEMTKKEPFKILLWNTYDHGDKNFRKG